MYIPLAAAAAVVSVTRVAYIVYAIAPV